IKAPSPQPKLPSKDSNNRTIAARIIVYISILILFKLSIKGRIAALNPKIKSIFTKFVPAIFPTAISPDPSPIAVSPTANSGRLVPIETTVRPMTIGLIRRSIAILEAPFNKISAPTVITINPNKKVKTALMLILICSQVVLQISYFGTKKHIQTLQNDHNHIFYSNLFLSLTNETHRTDTDGETNRS